jgi:hypothetical protein
MKFGFNIPYIVRKDQELNDYQKEYEIANQCIPQRREVNNPYLAAPYSMMDASYAFMDRRTHQNSFKPQNLNALSMNLNISNKEVFLIFCLSV